MNKLEQEYKNFLITRSYILNEELEEDLSERNKRLLFLVEYVANLTIYCDDYSIRIGEVILDIMKYIFSHSYPQSKIRSIQSYVCYPYDLEYKYIVYVQFIIEYLEWGTNIYHAWFDQKKEILGYKLTKENLEYLINWFDGEI